MLNRLIIGEFPCCKMICDFKIFFCSTKVHDSKRDNLFLTISRHIFLPIVVFQVDKRLTELRDGFASGILAMGDTGDAARDLHNIYGLPKAQSSEANTGENKQAEATQNGHT